MSAHSQPLSHATPGGKNGDTNGPMGTTITAVKPAPMVRISDEIEISKCTENQGKQAHSQRIWSIVGDIEVSLPVKGHTEGSNA